MQNRCQVLPLPNYQFQFLVDGQEKTRWHFDSSYPRPFFYPTLCGSGESLTRMGHPGASNHDHHRSVWFAHHKVFGHDFWADGKGTQIRQREWLAIRDGELNAALAVQLDWVDGHDPTPLLTQEVIAELTPLDKYSWTLELHSRFTPSAEELELQQTNFGFLAVRVSKQLAGYFGGGKLTNSEGQETEKHLFGKAARWMDYSGLQFSHSLESPVAEGVTYIDHPSNPGQPTKWHVREDGWMGASPCMSGPLKIEKSSPLSIRYLLHFHHGRLQPDLANEMHKKFASSPALQVVRSRKPHTHAEILRQGK